MIQSGTFKARGVSATVIKSQNKGTPGVSVTLRLEEGPDKGSMIDWTGWLTEGTKARTAESLALLGFDGQDLATITRKEVVAVIEHEEYTTETGEPRVSAKVRWLNDPARGASRFEEVSPAEKQQLLSELRGLVLAAKKPEPAKERPRF